MKDFVNWLRASFEGSNKSASSRRVTTFWFVALETIISLAIVTCCIFLVLTEESRPQALDSIYKLIIFSVISRVSIFLLMSIITWQNITDTVNAVKGTTVLRETREHIEETAEAESSEEVQEKS